MKTDQKFWFKWMFHYSLGELMGIGAAAIIARFLFIGFSNTSASANTTSYLMFMILIIAGASEGLIIGYIQWRSLSKVVKDFKRGVWIGTTMAITVTGWLCILPPAILFISFLSKFSAINNYYSILYTTYVGMAFGGLIGIAQFFIIRKYFRNSLVWIFANTVGWTISFLILYKALVLFENSSSLVYNLFLIASSCILSGFIQGVITGTSLHFLMSIRREHEHKNTSIHLPLPVNR